MKLLTLAFSLFAQLAIAQTSAPIDLEIGQSHTFRVAARSTLR